MTRPRLLALALAALATAGVAQTARGPQAGPSPRALYHQGARQFVDGEQAAALASVQAGLRAAPGDARLQALRDLIQQQQDEQDNQDGGQQGDAQNQDGSDQGEDGDQGQDGQEYQNQDGQDGGPEAARDQTGTGTPPPAQPGQAPPQAGTPGQMSAAQADRILDAVGGEERLLLREMRRESSQRPRSDKDW